MTPYNDYDDYSSDVDFETNTSGGNDRDAWFKGIKNTTYRCSFSYFHRYDVNAVNKARRDNPKITQADIQEIARKAIEARAEELGKAAKDLTENDLLDRRTVKFKKLRGHFQEGLGFIVSRLGMDGPENDRVWKQLPEPRVYYSTVMIFYPTINNKGEVPRDKEAFQNGWSVRPCRLSEPNYQEFEKINNSLGANGISLAGQDFTMECTDQVYQKFKASSAGPAIWLKSNSFADQVLTRSREWYPKLVPFREMTSDQLRQKLGGGGGTSAGSLPGGSAGSLPGGGETNFDDILGNV